MFQRLRLRSIILIKVIEIKNLIEIDFNRNVIVIEIEIQQFNRNNRNDQNLSFD